MILYFKQDLVYQRFMPILLLRLEPFFGMVQQKTIGGRPNLTKILINQQVFNIIDPHEDFTLHFLCLYSWLSVLLFLIQ